MTTAELDAVERVWPDLSPLLSVPRTEEQYDHLVEILDGLIDRVGEDEAHPLASLMEVLGVLIAKYEDEHLPELTAA